jgi:hypothetical protein
MVRLMPDSALHMSWNEYVVLFGTNPERINVLNRVTNGKGIKHAEAKATFCRDWRNRHIAHRNLDLALERAAAKPLESGSRMKMREAIDAIADVIHVVGDHFCQPRISFRVPVHSGAEHLLYILDDWLELQQTRKEEVERGVISEWGFGRREL